MVQGEAVGQAAEAVVEVDGDLRVHLHPEEAVGFLVAVAAVEDRRPDLEAEAGHLVVVAGLLLEAVRPEEVLRVVKDRLIRRRGRSSRWLTRRLSRTRLQAPRRELAS